jgi:hypothetical protein
VALSLLHVGAICVVPVLHLPADVLEVALLKERDEQIANHVVGRGTVPPVLRACALVMVAVLGDPVPELLSLRLTLMALWFEPFLRKNLWKTSEPRVHRGGTDPLLRYGCIVGIIVWWWPSRPSAW